MHVALFIHRYPPAVGGAELYAERLAKYCEDAGDDVTVWTSTAVELSEMWFGESRDRKGAAASQVKSLQAHIATPSDDENHYCWGGRSLAVAALEYFDFPR